MVASSTSRSSYTPTSEDSSSQTRSQNENTVIEIAAHGDIVLDVEHDFGTSKAKHAFRVSSPTLKSNSKYFERLLQPGRFGEAINIENQHNILREQYKSITEAPPEELPVVHVEELGRISTIRAVDALLTDFLYILHGKDTQTFPPVANLANLAIVADRFDALDIVKTYVRRKKMVRSIDGKTTPKADAALSEEKCRQRLLVGLLLDYSQWVEKYSARIITKGWIGKDADTSTALWWDLPLRVEEEMMYRRDCILETIQSLQSHFLALYTSRERQCKLGYDTSAQCDSFQLGEMVRFFTRTGTLQFQGIMSNSNEPAAPYSGDLSTLIDTMKQVPEYQIDRFHHHCGLRIRILPSLDLLEMALKYIGMCSECWQANRHDYSWLVANRPLLWSKQDWPGKTLGPLEHNHKHDHLRSFFTAAERSWGS